MIPQPGQRWKSITESASSYSKAIVQIIGASKFKNQIKTKYYSIAKLAF